MSRTRGLQLRNLRARGGGRSVSLGWGGGGTDLAYSPLKVSYRRFSFPRFRPDVRGTKSANLTFCFVLHTPALSGPPPCISTSCSFFKKLGVCCPSQKNIVVYSHISLYIGQTGGGVLPLSKPSLFLIFALSSQALSPPERL